MLLLPRCHRLVDIAVIADGASIHCDNWHEDPVRCGPFSVVVVVAVASVVIVIAGYRRSALLEQFKPAVVIAESDTAVPASVRRLLSL